MSPRAIARFTAACRLAIGAGFVANPALTMRPWLGRDARRSSAMLLARAVGARDLVLAAGTLGSLSSTPALRRWLAGGLVADGTDFAVTLAARDSLPSAGRALVLSTAGTAVALGVVAVATLD